MNHHLLQFALEAMRYVNVVNISISTGWLQMPTTVTPQHAVLSFISFVRHTLLAGAIANSCISLLFASIHELTQITSSIVRQNNKNRDEVGKSWCFEKQNDKQPTNSNNNNKTGDRHFDERVNSVSAFKMFISVLVTFASTTIKIYLEFSENELFEKMKGFVAIVSTHRHTHTTYFV